jgi:hypothetical protein
LRDAARAWLAVLLAATAGHGCRTASPASPAPPAPQAVAAPGAADEPGAALLGRWEYVAPPRPAPARPALHGGVRVALEFDSAAGTRAFGRVTLWFAGDLGLGPGMFDVVDGAVAPDGAAHLTIPFARSTSAPLTVEGMLAGDTLRITASRQGVDEGPLAPTAVFVRREGS